MLAMPGVRRIVESSFTFRADRHMAASGHSGPEAVPPGHKAMLVPGKAAPVLVVRVASGYCAALLEHVPKGEGMKAMLITGKALTLSFWLLCGVALAGVLSTPFAQLIYLLAAFVLVLHGLQLWLFAGSLGRHASPWLDRVQVLLFGIFHLYPLNSAGLVVVY